MAISCMRMESHFEAFVRESQPNAPTCACIGRSCWTCGAEKQGDSKRVQEALPGKVERLRCPKLCRSRLL